MSAIPVSRPSRDSPVFTKMEFTSLLDLRTHRTRALLPPVVAVRGFIPGLDRAGTYSRERTREGRAIGVAIAARFFRRVSTCGCPRTPFARTNREPGATGAWADWRTTRSPSNPPTVMVS